jgi:hypothetical protein
MVWMFRRRGMDLRWNSPLPAVGRVNTGKGVGDP